MLYILVAILMFGVLIAVHEFGHFITAKLFGIRVNEFSIGMGPALLKKEKGETLYSLRLLPIGGYCAMEGEDEESDDPRAFGNAAGWKKVIVLVAGAFMNFLTGLIIVLVLYAPAQGFYQETYAGAMEGYGTRTAASRKGTVFSPWTATRCSPTATLSSIWAAPETPWTWWWSATARRSI